MNRLEEFQPNIPALIQLRDLMIENQPRLAMANYYTSTGHDEHWCLTSCCVAGYGLVNGIAIPPQIQSTVDTIKEGNLQYHDKIKLGETYSYNILGTPPDIEHTGRLLLPDSFEFLFGARNSNNIDHAIDRLNYMIEHQTPPLMCRRVGKDTPEDGHQYGLEYTTTSVKQFLEHFPQLIPTVANHPCSKLDLFNVYYYYVGIIDARDGNPLLEIADDGQDLWHSNYHTTAYAFTDKTLIPELQSFLDNVEWIFQPDGRRGR